MKKAEMVTGKRARHNKRLENNTHFVAHVFSSYIWNYIYVIRRKAAEFRRKKKSWILVSHSGQRISSVK